MKSSPHDVARSRHRKLTVHAACEAAPSSTAADQREFDGENCCCDSGKPAHSATTVTAAIRMPGVAAGESQGADDHLRVAATRYQRLIESSNAGIVIADAQTGQILDVNPYLLELLGYRLEECFEKKFWDLCGFNDDPTGREIFGHLQETGYLHYEERLLATKDGRQIVVELICGSYVFESRKLIQCDIQLVMQRRREEQLLRLEHGVAVALAEADGETAAVGAVLRAVCETLGWECGRFLQVNQEANELHCTQTWHIQDAAIEHFIASKRELVTPRGAGLAGLAWRSGLPVWSADVQHDPRALRSATAHQAGMHGALSFPIIGEGKTLGVLAFNSRTVHEPDESLLNSLHMIGRQIGQLLQRLEQQSRIARLSRIQAVLSGINSLIVRVRDRQELFDEACRIAVEAGGFGIAFICSFDPVTQEVTPVASAGVDVAILADQRFTARADQLMGQGVVGRAVRQKTAVFDNDITRSACVGGSPRQKAVERGYCSVIALPLMVEGAVAGTLSLFAKGRNFFDADELKLLGELAGDISFALEHIGKEERLAKLSRVESVTSEIRSLIVRTRDRQQLFDEVCRVAVEYGNFGTAWIGVLDAATQEVSTVAWAGRFAANLLLSSKASGRVVVGEAGVVGRAISEKRTIVDNDIAATPDEARPRRAAAIRAGFRSQIAMPFVTDGSVVGHFALWANEANFFDADEVKLLSGLAADIAFALESITRREKLEKLMRIRAVSGEINAAIVRISDRETLLRETCRIAVEHGRFDLVWIGSIDQETRCVQPVVWAGFSAETAHAVSWATIAGTRGCVGESFQTGQVAFRNDVGSVGVSGKLRAEALDKGYRSMVCLPLLRDGKVVALVALYAVGAGFFDAEELALLEEVAADVSFAIAHIDKQERLEYFAYYDVLTALPNRTLFLDRLNQQMAARSAEPGVVALVLLDLERFRMVNETLGRQGGDDLLRQVAQRLTQACSGTEHLARIDADGFGIVVRGAPDAVGVAQVLEHEILACFREPYTVNATEIRLAAKAGIALFPADGDDADTLFRNAEAALKKAKRSSERYLFYAAEMNARAALALSLETRLRAAVESEQFVLHYQPKVELASGLISGAEALIRWQDPTQSALVPPASFIPILEETGLILEVGAWAVRRALADHDEWQARGLHPPCIAVNVSQIQLRQKDFVSMVRRALEQSKAAPDALELEITESLIMENAEENIRKLKAVRDLGVSIAIDDFGTGYSSLGYLARLPVNSLKIDRSFIIRMTHDPDSMTIVSTIVSLAHSLNLKVIAEGVETEEQSRYLKLLKCDEMQGYLFSKPVAKEQMSTMLEVRS